MRFPSYGILPHMENALASSSISHSIGKCSKIQQMEKVWEIGIHTFFIV